MVSKPKLTWEERCELDRKRRIEIALELGDPAYVEYCRTMEYGTEAEDARLFNQLDERFPKWRPARNLHFPSPPAERGEMPQAEGGSGRALTRYWKLPTVTA